MRMLMLLVLVLGLSPVFAEEKQPEFTAEQKEIGALIHKMRYGTGTETLAVVGEYVKKGYSLHNIKYVTHDAYPVAGNAKNLLAEILSTARFTQDEKEPTEAYVEAFHALLAGMEARATSEDDFRQMVQDKWLSEAYLTYAGQLVDERSALQDLMKEVPSADKDSQARLKAKIARFNEQLQSMHRMKAEYDYALKNGTVAGFGKKKNNAKGAKPRKGKKKKAGADDVHDAD